MMEIERWKLDIFLGLSPGVGLRGFNELAKRRRAVVRAILASAMERSRARP